MRCYSVPVYCLPYPLLCAVKPALCYWCNPPICIWVLWLLLFPYLSRERFSPTAIKRTPRVKQISYLLLFCRRSTFNSRTGFLFSPKNWNFLRARALMELINISNFSQVFSADVVVQIIIGALKSIFLIKPPCDAVFFKNPKENFRETLVLQFTHDSVQQFAPISFSHERWQQINRNHFSWIRMLLKSWFTETAGSDIFSVFNANHRWPSGNFKVFDASPLGNSIQIVLRNDSFIGISPAFFINCWFLLCYQMDWYIWFPFLMPQNPDWTKPPSAVARSPAD